MENYKSRLNVPDKYKWNLNDFYKNIEEWEDERKHLNSEMKKLEEYKGKINDPKLMEEYLDLYNNIRCRLLNLYAYAYLNHDVDLNNSKYMKILQSVTSMYTDFNIAIAFFNPELLDISEEDFNNLFIKNKNLIKYKNMLEKIYEKKKYTLSQEKEQLISMLSETYDSYENISTSLLNSENDYGRITTSDGDNVEILLSNLRKLKHDKSDKIRMKVDRKFYKVIERYQNTYASLLNNFVKNNVVLAKVHNYDSVWDMYLKDAKLTNKIFKSLQSACDKKIDVNKKYFNLMKKVLNLDILHSYDTSLDWNESSFEYTIEQANNIVINSLSMLGREYTDKLKKIFDNHYIDYCGYKGKTNGGYSYSTYDKPSRILMNFRNTFDDILTIAHEAGHNVHHQFVNEDNYPWYRSQAIIICEVASLTNEFLLTNYFINNSKSKKEKLLGLENIIKTYQANFFGAIMEGQLEVKMYDLVENGSSITSDFLNNEISKLLKKFEGDSVKRNKYSKYIWAIRRHYYMVYYLFSYAISVSVASNLAKRIINKEEGILDKYYKFLKCGSDMDPINVFKILDVDIEDEDVFIKGIEYFDEQLNLYEKIYNDKEV